MSERKRRAELRSLTFTVEVRTYSIANERVHWSGSSKRAQDERLATLDAYRKATGRRCVSLRLPVAATLVRIGPRSLDSDNLAISQKHVRDELALILGVDDADDRVTWDYAQEKGREYSTRVELKEVVS